MRFFGGSNDWSGGDCDPPETASRPEERNWYLPKVDIGVLHPEIIIVNDAELRGNIVCTPALAAIRPITPVLTLKGKKGKFFLRDYMEVGRLMLVRPALKELFEAVDPEGFDFMKVDATYEGHGPVDYWFAEVTRVLDVIDLEPSELLVIQPGSLQSYGMMHKIVVGPVDSGIRAFRMKFAESTVLIDQLLRDRMVAGRFTGVELPISTKPFDF